jgi:adenylate kinase
MEIEATIAKGNLLDDDTALRVLVERTSDLAKGYVLDGFPRTVYQAELLLAIESLTPINGAVYYDLSDKASVERLSGRLTCPVCERSYHDKSELPKNDNLCDDDGATLFRRPEDHADAIVTRLRLFHQQTQPLLSYFEGRGLLIKVDASGGPESIFESTVSLVAEKAN